jgi:cytochrome P450
MLRDFADHRHQQRIMQVAFRKEALADYSRRLGPHIAEAVEDWAAVKDFRCHPAIKTLTLNLTARVFLGLELGPEATGVNRALIDTLNASMAFIRLPIPGLKFYRGLHGRRFLTKFFHRLIVERRASTATDMLTRLCHAVSEDGERYADQDILDHMIFLLMAAHDTITSSLSTSVYALARHTDWQEKVRSECLAAGWAPLPDERLDELLLTERVFNEALRLYAPVPYIPRRALKAFEYRGYTIPANTQILLCTDLVHQDPDIWTHPERFDPDRFSPERSEHKRHAFAFLPYGGGAHKCIGMIFAANLARQFLHQLLIRYRLALHPGYHLPMQQVPIPKPRDGLPMQLTRLA